MSSLQAISINLSIIVCILIFSLTKIYDILLKIHLDLERISKLEKDFSSNPHREGEG